MNCNFLWVKNLFCSRKTRNKDKNTNNTQDQIQKLNDIKFQSLTPQNDIIDETSFKALDFALGKDNVHNIAVTGNYGSGKSSIINSYFRDRLKKDCLQISLATFAIDKKNTIEEQKTSERELPDTTIQEIEKSILQQIFYKKSGIAFPFSRFNRIKNYTKRRILLIEIILLPILLMATKIIKNDWWVHLKKCITFQYSIPSFIISVLATITALIILFFLIRFVGRLKLNKFSFIKAEFGLGDIDNESLLNKYIDELLYFFETSDYRIVIFEDLDRFENSEIFIKLRELNTILNNYEKINRKIVFIYALRDEVFTDSSRTKFFDFIIPVIPVINCQNSMDMLLRMQNNNPNTAFSKVNSDFLQDVGLYVDDMRLLINCINEFRIYDEKINSLSKKDSECQNRTVLFAIILYKNLYPKDFSDLTFNKGFLYKIFQKKDEMIKAEILKLKNQNVDFENEVKKLETYDGVSINQLRREYVEAILSEINSWINPRHIDKYLSDENFMQLVNTKNIILQTTGGNSTYSFNWDMIQSKVNPNFTYEENAQFIKNNSDGKKEILSKSIKENNGKINELRNSPIKDLQFLSNIVNEIITEESKINKDLILFLLQNGYIDENYFDYISIFYPESITDNDKKYLLLIKNNKEPVFDLQLSKISNVIGRIRNNEWKRYAILNNDFLSFLLQKNESKNILNFISIMYLYDLDNSGNTFFSQYENEKKEELEILDMNINNYIYDKNLDYKVFFSERNYDRLFIFFTNINRIDNTKYINFIKRNTGFLARSMDNDTISTVIQKLKKMDIKVMDLSSLQSFPIFQELIKNSMYEINRENLIAIIESRNETTYEKNSLITDIEMLNDPILTDYIEKDLNKLIDSVLIPMPENLEEAEKVIVSFLNSDEITHDRKEFLIKNNKSLITELTNVNQIATYETEEGQMVLDSWELLLQENKIKPTWNNIYSYYKEKKLSKELITFIETHINDLSKDIVITEEEKKDTESEKYKLIVNLFSDLLGCNDFNLDTYEKVLRIAPWGYKEIGNYDLDEIHLLALCISGRLVLTKQNYNGVRSHSIEACTRLLCRYFDNLFTDYPPDYVEDKDILYLLPTALINKEQKIKTITSSIIDWSLVEDEHIINTIVKLIIENKLEIKVQLPLKNLLKVEHKKKVDNKTIIEVIQLQANNYSRDEMHEALSSLDEPYSILLENGNTEVALDKSIENEQLCELFKKKRWILSYHINNRGELKVRRLR